MTSKETKITRLPGKDVYEVVTATSRCLVTVEWVVDVLDGSPVFNVDIIILEQNGVVSALPVSICYEVTWREEGDNKAVAEYAVKNYQEWRTGEAQ